MVMLTMPADGKLRDPTEYMRRLALYKESFVNHDIISIIMGAAAGPLSRIGMERSHHDIQVLELVLTLFRNLLSIVPDRPNINDEFLFALDKEHVLMLILHLSNQAEAPENARFPLLLLELIHLAFQAHDPFTLATTPNFDISTMTLPTTTLQKTTGGHPKPATLSDLSSSTAILPDSNLGGTTQSPPAYMSTKGAALAAALEANGKKLPKLSSPNSGLVRHSRFGGVVVSSPTVKANVKLSSLVSQPNEEQQEQQQFSKKKPPKNTEFTEDPSRTSSSVLSISEVLSPKLYKSRKLRSTGTAVSSASLSSGRDLSSSFSAASSNMVTKLVLKKFATNILEHCFNDLLRFVKPLIQSHSPNLVDRDYDHYVWAIGFFPAFLSAEFQKSSADEGRVNLDIGNIQVIFEEATFYYLLEQLERYETEKNAAKVEIHFLALKHLIFTLLALYNSGLEDYKRISESIVLKLIYNPELLVDRLPRLVRTFTKMKRGQRFILPQLVEGVHLFLSLLENISEDGMKKLVQLKRRTKATMIGSSLLGGDEEEQAMLMAHKSLGDEVDEEDDGFIDRSKDKDADVAKDEGDKSSAAASSAIPSNEVGDASAKSGQENSVKRMRTKDLLDEEHGDGGSDDDAHDSKAVHGTDDEYATRAEQLKDLLRTMQRQQEEEEDEDDHARHEKYFDVQDYIVFYSKQSILNAIMELLRTFEANLERTNEAALGMLRRIDSIGGLPMLYQVSYLRIFASMLTERPAVALGPASLALKDFARRVAGTFLDRFANDPVTFGLTSLWPKKLNQARDLNDGLYLTIDSVYDGTLERYEERRRQPDHEEPGHSQQHRTNPSLVTASYNQKARPYMGEGLEGTPDFDLGTLLSKHDSSSASKPTSAKSVRKTKEELIEKKWQALKLKQRRQWTEKEVEQVMSLYASYSDLGDMDVIPLIASMLETESSCTLTDIYLKLEEVLDKEEVKKLKRPELDDSELPDFGTAPSPMDSDEEVEVISKKPRKKLVSSTESEKREKDVEEPREAFAEGDTLNDSSSSDESGFESYRQSKSGGKTAKQIRNEMLRRKLELQSLEAKRKKELSELSEKRREERAEQKKVREAEEKETKEKRQEEKKEARVEKERLRVEALETKAAAKREMQEAKLREKAAQKLRRLEDKGAKKASGKRGRPVPKDPEADSGSGSEEHGGTQVEEPMARTRPKRATAGRRRTQSEFDKLIEGLDSSASDEAGTSKTDISLNAQMLGDAAMDVDKDEGEEKSDKDEALASSSIKKGKRKRPSKNDEEDEEYMDSADRDDEEHQQSETEEETRPKRSKPTSSKRKTPTAKKASTTSKQGTASSPSSSAATAPVKKKPKLSNSTTQPDSAPLEIFADPTSSVFTTVEEEDEHYHTATTISLGTPNKRRLVKNVEQDKQPNQDDDDDDLLL